MLQGRVEGPKWAAGGGGTGGGGGFGGGDRCPDQARAGSSHPWTRQVCMMYTIYTSSLYMQYNLIFFCVDFAFISHPSHVVNTSYEVYLVHTLFVACVVRTALDYIIYLRDAPEDQV